MATDIKDGAGNVIIRGSDAGNRGMDPQKPLYTQEVTAAGTPAAGGAASAAAPVNSSTVTADANGALTAGAAAQLVAANSGRQLAMISNTGANPMTVRFGADPTVAVGHPIAPGATLVLDTKCPTAAIRGFSTSGTTWFVTTG